MIRWIIVLLTLVAFSFTNVDLAEAKKKRKLKKKRKVHYELTYHHKVKKPKSIFVFGLIMEKPKIENNKSPIQLVFGLDFSKTSKHIKTLVTKLNPNLNEGMTTTYSKSIEKYSTQYGIDPFITTCVIKVESNFDPDAIQRRTKCYGSMQIQLKSHRERLNRLNILPNQLFDVDPNINVGTDLLAELNEKYNGNMHRSLTYYSGGSRTYANKVLSCVEYARQDIKSEQYTGTYNNVSLALSIL